MVHNHRQIEASRSLYPGRNLHTSVADDWAGRRSKDSGSPRPTTNVKKSKYSIMIRSIFDIENLSLTKTKNLIYKN